jgi:predicted aldo/keto reductase-like oxidoreductase
MMGNLFMKLGIRQEHFIEEEMDIRKIVFEKNKCKPDCNKCKDYCPLGLDVTTVLSE